MSAADKVAARLAEIARSMSGSVEVGFLENATYPDGTPVAAVAFFNEYGTSTIPARPFFRNMIAAESPSWPEKMSKLAKTGASGSKILNLMGEDIEGALKQSINDFSDPGNADSTIARKGFNKPLIDTSHMINSTGYRVTGAQSSNDSDSSEDSFEEIAEEIAESPEALL